MPSAPPAVELPLERRATLALIIFLHADTPVPSASWQHRSQARVSLTTLNPVFMRNTQRRGLHRYLQSGLGSNGFDEGVIGERRCDISTRPASDAPEAKPRGLPALGFPAARLRVSSARSPSACSSGGVRERGGGFLESIDPRVIHEIPSSPPARGRKEDALGPVAGFHLT